MCLNLTKGTILCKVCIFKPGEKNIPSKVGDFQERDLFHTNLENKRQLLSFPPGPAILACREMKEAQ